MKAIILAAGQGQRLRPYTNEIPKCMVKLHNKPLIDYILETFKSCNIENITIIGGYKSDVLKSYLAKYGFNFIENKNYNLTNMVSTLFCAEDQFDDDIIISYSDIIYKKQALECLINSKENFSVVVDKAWQKLWELRQENPLHDAETMKIKNGNIIELGKKPQSLNEIEAQYIGLIKISKNILPQIVNFYKNLDKKVHYDQNSFENMYMTSFIQLIIDNLMPVKPVYIESGWLEVDTIQDLNVYEKSDYYNKLT